MPTPVLATKLFVPARRSRLVARPRLIQQLNAALVPGCKLTLVSAPAGFGKTTLVSDWIAHCAQYQPSTRAAWLSLDEGDNDPSRLLTHLVVALHGIDADIGSDALHLLHNAPTLQVEPILTALINDVTRASEQTLLVLVLDDYHVIEAPAHEAVTFLVDHLPSRLRLVVASRSDPPIPLARLRTRGELTELRADDLRFTPDESERFLNKVMGLRLSTNDVDALETRTEGWVAGLQLAALSLQNREDASAFIGAFTGSHRFVIDYLVEEVLQQQPDDVRDFLLDTAVLDRLTGALCDALTGRGDGTGMLETLERANLFVVPLDDQRKWYRYHHLFADVLRARMLSKQPERVSVLHQLASAWYERNNFPEDAVRHALAAGDFERAAYLVELALPEIRRHRHDAMLLGWLKALPDDVIRRKPVLSVFYAWMMLVSGDLNAVETRLRDAGRALRGEAGTANTSVDTEELRTLPATIAVYRASLAQARGDVAGTAEHARHALELAGPADHLPRAGAAGFLGLAAWANGDVETALQTFSEAVASLKAAGNLADELSSTMVLGDMWIVAGRPGKARQLYEHALQQATEANAVLPVTADLHVAMSEIYRELGEIGTATLHLETAKSLGERASMTESRYRWFVAMARVREAEGDPEAATELLDQAERLYLRGFFPEVRPIAAMKARIRIAQGKLSEAGDWARQRGVSASDDLSYLREFDHLTLVRLLIAQYRVQRGDTAIREAVEFLQRLLEAAEGRAGSLVEVLMLQALAHEAQGDMSLAIEALEAALAAAPEPYGYVRLFLDEGEPMVSLLRYAEERRLLGDHPRRLLHAGTTVELGAASRQGAPGATGSPYLVEPLSDRELQVLRLLNSDLSGPQIAQELFISLNTLRTHSKHIFTKLGVSSRRAAVRRAQEEGLI
ncbi:MAG: LuxR C-terminal-related transcriptional regulator [Actinomycetota bacterium]|nr:LuxR C-terminal-related transcriptional regulator [Actinomycetota bacterium]